MLWNYWWLKTSSQAPQFFSVISLRQRLIDVLLLLPLHVDSAQDDGSSAVMELSPEKQQTMMFHALNALADMHSGDIPLPLKTIDMRAAYWLLLQHRLHCPSDHLSFLVAIMASH